MKGNWYNLAVDQMGVGYPVVDMLREAKLPVVAVSIHGGANVTKEGYTYRRAQGGLGEHHAGPPADKAPRANQRQTSMLTAEL